MDDETKESLGGILKQLEFTQAATELEMFNVLNKHDDIINLFNENVDKLLGFVSCMEGIEFLALKMSEEINEHKNADGEHSSTCVFKKDIQELVTSFLGEQHILQELCTSMQNLINLMNDNCDIIHKLEDNVAANRSTINNLSCFVK